MKILIINTVSKEKVLLATPIIRLLKTELDADIHVLVKANYLHLLETNPYLGQLEADNAPLFKLRKQLRSEKFDWIIDLQAGWRSKFLRIGLHGKTLSIRKQTFATWLYLKIKVNRLPKIHLVDQYLGLLTPLAIKEDSLGIDFFIPEKDEVENGWLPPEHQQGYAAIIITASHRTKKLPVNRLIELCDRINKPIVLIGEREDESIAEEIAAFFKKGSAQEEEAIEELNKKSVIFNACGKFNFNQSASLIKNANWVFTYDNVMMHVASTFKKPLFTMWGSSTPHFGTYPYRTQFTVFENNKLNCRPCTKTGFNNCPKGHFKCMIDLKFDFYLPD